MTRFVAGRLGQMVVVLFAVSVLTFLIFNVIPNGDPASRMAGKSPTETQVEAIRAEWGFDEPLPVQYLRTMEQVLGGQAISYFTQLNVRDEILRGLPRTLALAVGAAILWMAFGIALGLLGALRAGRLSDRLLTFAALAGVSLPVFWLGAILSHFLGYEWGLFPNGGYVPFAEDPLDWAYHLVLPCATLAVLFTGFYSRLVRSNVLDTMGEDFVRTARAKGLSERRVLLAHVLRNALIPVVTLWGLDFGAVVAGGAILTETVFDIQGVGQYAAESVGQLDVPPVLAVTLFGAFFIVVLNTAVDIAYALLDPRIRVGER